MQQIKQPNNYDSLAQRIAPKKKATNRKVTPVVPGYENGRPVQQPGFGMPVDGNGKATDAQPQYQGGVNTPDYLKPGNGKPMADPTRLEYRGGNSTSEKPPANKGRYDPPAQTTYVPPRKEQLNNKPTSQPTSQSTVGGLLSQGTYNPAVYESVTDGANAPTSNYQDREYQSVTDAANAPTSNYQDRQYQSVIGGAAANAPTANTPQTTFNRKNYQSNGYNGVQGETEFNYDPREESLVQNQITGLLDPNSELMRKAISQAQSYSAGRGLQSSSIGSETALSTMIDKAMPIAQQDAATYGNADQIGWQNSFTADQNNLSRQHDASMFDKQGELTTNLQNDQLEFNNDQNNANRTQQTQLQELQYLQNLGLLDAQGQQDLQKLNAQQSFQAEMQDLQYKQSLGMLDAQGAQRLQELNVQQGFQAEMQDLQYKQSLGMLDAQGAQRLQELNAQQSFNMDMQNLTFNQNNSTLDKQAELQERRDALLNQFDVDKTNNAFLQDLEKTQLTWEHDDAVFERNLNGQFQLEYKTATATAYNSYLEQVAAVFSNPNMTPEQQTAGANYLKQMFEAQRQQMQIIYGSASGQVTDAYNPPSPNDQLNIPYNAGDPQQPIIPSNPSSGGSGGGISGMVENAKNQVRSNSNGGANGRVTGGGPNSNWAVRQKLK